MHNTLLHIILHKNIISYHILHTTTQIIYTTLYGKITQNQNPTMYSIVSTHYYILNLSNKFYSCHVKCEVSPYETQSEQLLLHNKLGIWLNSVSTEFNPTLRISIVCN